MLPRRVTRMRDWFVALEAETNATECVGLMDIAEKQKRLSLLLVDDDAELCGMMKEFFAAAGFDVDCACNGAEGLARAVNGAYDLAVLDVMMPALDGFSLLEQLRRRKDLPVIMLTARVQQKDRIQGLNAGADDYLPKPFDPDELLARVRAVLRRAEPAQHTEIEELAFGSLRISPATREIWTAGIPIDLTEMEFDLLELLIRSAGRVVSRDEITAALFAREASPYDRFLDVHMSHLRKKLKAGRRLIRTIRGVGYMFTGVR
jgi:two-component system response regulator CpxR